MRRACPNSGSAVMVFESWCFYMIYMILYRGLAKHGQVGEWRSRHLNGTRDWRRTPGADYACLYQVCVGPDVRRDGLIRVDSETSLRMSLTDSLLWTRYGLKADDVISISMVCSLEWGSIAI